MHKAPVTLNFNECYFLPLFSSPEATASVCPTDQELVESASDYFNPSAFSAMHKEADNKGTIDSTLALKRDFVPGNNTWTIYNIKLLSFSSLV